MAENNIIGWVNGRPIRGSSRAPRPSKFTAEGLKPVAAGMPASPQNVTINGNMYDVEDMAGYTPSSAAQPTSPPAPGNTQQLRVMDPQQTDADVQARFNFLVSQTPFAANPAARLGALNQAMRDVKRQREEQLQLQVNADQYKTQNELQKASAMAGIDVAKQGAITSQKNRADQQIAEQQRNQIKEQWKQIFAEQWTQDGIDFTPQELDTHVERFMISRGDKNLGEGLNAAVLDEERADSEIQRQRLSRPFIPEEVGSQVARYRQTMSDADQADILRPYETASKAFDYTTRNTGGGTPFTTRVTPGTEGRMFNVGMLTNPNYVPKDDYLGGSGAGTAPVRDERGGTFAPGPDAATPPPNVPDQPAAAPAQPAANGFRGVFPAIGAGVRGVSEAVGATSRALQPLAREAIDPTIAQLSNIRSALFGGEFRPPYSPGVLNAIRSIIAKQRQQRQQPSDLPEIAQ